MLSIQSKVFIWDIHKHRLCDIDSSIGTFERIHLKEDVWDYSLFLIDQLLSNFNKSLRDWPDIPQVQQEWEDAIEKSLIACERLQCRAGGPVGTGMY